MKLNWRETSDGERWFANTDRGQVLIDKAHKKDGPWFIEWFYLEPEWRGPLMFFSAGKRFVTADEAMAAVEQWYFPKADQCES